MSSADVQKRGRPKKAEGEMMSGAGKEVPPSKATKKVNTKPSTKPTTKPTTPKTTSSKPKAKAVSSTAAPAETEFKVLTPTPITVKPNTSVKSSKSNLASQSKILQELAALDAIALQNKAPGISKEIQKLESVAATPESSQVTTTSTPTTLPLPIPSHQATTMPSIIAPFLYPHNPSSSVFQRTYMSTKSNPPEGSPKALPRKPYISPKELNAFIVNEQSSRGGPGAGAEHTRAERAKAEAPRLEGSRPGELPAKYKPAARRYVNSVSTMKNAFVDLIVAYRVTAIIVALPIVFVTSYILYERREFQKYLPMHMDFKY
jgi:hypothetical protein